MKRSLLSVVALVGVGVLGACGSSDTFDVDPTQASGSGLLRRLSLGLRITIRRRSLRRRMLRRWSLTGMRFSVISVLVSVRFI